MKDSVISILHSKLQPKSFLKLCHAFEPSPEHFNVWRMFNETEFLSCVHKACEPILQDVVIINCPSMCFSSSSFSSTIQSTCRNKNFTSFDICLHLHLYLDCFDQLFHFPKNEVELNFQFFQLHLSFTSLGGFVRFVSLSPNIHSMNQSFKWQLPKNCGSIEKKIYFTVSFDKVGHARRPFVHSMV